MEVKDLHRYSKDVDSVFKFFSDPQAITAKYAGVGARNIEVVESVQKGKVHTSKVKREVPADVPALLQKFLGAWNKVVQTENWQSAADGGRTCDLKVDILGVPVSVTGTMALRPQPGGCTNDVRINVTCGIPLIGRKLADFVAADTKKAMDAEYAYISEQLTRS